MSGCFLEGTMVHKMTNIYGDTFIPVSTKVGAFVEITGGVKIGKRCKISSHSFLCDGVILEDEVFIGHGVMFCNDMYPRSCEDGVMINFKGDEIVPTWVKKGASIGSGCVILPGVTIGEGAMVGAGSTVVRNLDDGETYYNILK
tara:strand:- start:5969 stop:6400 length:432 start_codon:yes stop_codon:yes gene_type:complete